MATVECPQCGTKYVIHLPIGSYFVTLLDNCELLIQRVSPIIAGGVCVGSLYWTCVTFGSVTVMQALGQQKGLIFMEKRGMIKNTMFVLFY
jgi:E3 ubiquitin-protein ligase MARCH5